MSNQKELIFAEVNGVSPSQLFAVVANKPYSFFLDSAEGKYKNRLGRYSFLGWDPFLILKAKANQIQLIRGTKVEQRKGDPFLALREILNRYQIKDIPQYLPPFLGGGVGYLGYDLCHFVEKVPSTAKDDLGLPDAYIAFYNSVFIIDHLYNKIFLSAISFTKKRKSKEIFEERLEEVQRSKKYPGTISPLPQGERDGMRENVPQNFFFPLPLGERIKVRGKKNHLLNSNFTKSQYLQAVQAAKKYIREGDIYQVNLSQRFHGKLTMAPEMLYQSLRGVNPAPFAGYLNFGQIKVLSSSPERFLKVKGREVQTRPIKGTRPRGDTEKKDKKLAEELLASTKDRAELIMIVDLERNDLGRICEFGSVKVPELLTLEAFPTVFHTVSTIEGQLKQGKDRIDLLKATFPGGSITGAPKIRSMEIIDELEPTTRGIYTGALGYFGFNDTMDINIVIRTLLVKNEDFYFQVGGGIVADSDPEKEFQETLDKAKALILACSRKTSG